MSENTITDVEFREVPVVPEEFAVETEETKLETRLLELMKPINEQIQKCESRADVLLLATAMMTTARDLFLCEIGKEATRILVSRLKFPDPVGKNADETQNS